MNIVLELILLITKFIIASSMVFAINVWINCRSVRNTIMVVVSVIALIAVSCRDFTSMPISNGMLLYYYT